MKIVNKMLAGVAMAAMPVAAHAAPIVLGSSINLNGYVIGNGGSNLGSSTSLDFTSQIGVATPGVDGTLTSYGSGTGTFAGLTCSGTCGTIADIANLSVGAQNITNFISMFGGNNADPINFALKGISEIDSVGGGTGLFFTAYGTLNYGNYTPTGAKFYFSAQGNKITSFSATAISGVPEASTWAMMILGVGAIGGALRRRQKTSVNYSFA